ncbi:uncharacterized protein LOC143447885 isoform X2 [Clavelina lepadiformis]|uniref:uncharacterized protein LOC143447885 isoform X2 n=1 Tax=Clavelina lepadiformis TaxID=159417 RepID=UPI004042FE28
MSRTQKQRKLEEITSLLQRCQEKSDIQLLLIQEKKKLQKELVEEKQARKKISKSHKLDADTANQNCKLKSEKQSQDSSRQKLPKSYHTKNGNMKEVLPKTTEKEVAAVSSNANKSKKEIKWNISNTAQEPALHTPRDEQMEEASVQDTNATNSKKTKKKKTLKGSNAHEIVDHKISQHKSTEKANHSSNNRTKPKSHKKHKSSNSDAQPTKSVNRATENGSISVRIFTKEEISQFSKTKRTLGIAQPPAYIEPPDYCENMQSTGKIHPVNGKYAVWKPIRCATVDGESSTYKTNVTSSPQIQRIKPSSSTSSISSKLMQLREESDNANKSLNKKEGTQRKLQSLKPRKLEHKVLNSQHSAPASLSPGTKKPQKKEPKLKNFEICHNSEEAAIGIISNVQKECTGTKQPSDNKLHLDGKVVFHMDLDKLADRQLEKKRLTNFFRRRVFRAKSLTRFERSSQTEINAEARMTQIYPWHLEDLCRTQGSQTINQSPSDKSTQTPQKAKTTTHSQTIQMTRETETQTTPILNDIGVQTEEDKFASGVSLDRIVRGQRRARSVHDKREEKSKEVKAFKRSSTLPSNYSNKRGEPTDIAPITSFQWSQTEKFVKVVVSHSGVHLLPANSIQVKTNGMDLRLKITKESSEYKDRNINNNNNSLQQSPSLDTNQLYVPQLYQPVVSASYTVQADMIAILLRKRSNETWKTLGIK